MERSSAAEDALAAYKRLPARDVPNPGCAFVVFKDRKTADDALEALTPTVRGVGVWCLRAAGAATADAAAAAGPGSIVHRRNRRGRGVTGAAAAAATTTELEPELEPSSSISVESIRLAIEHGVHAWRADRAPPPSGVLWRNVGVSGAFYTLVPIRPRSRGERRFIRTFPGVSLRPPLAFNTRPRRLSTPTDAFQLNPDVRSYKTTLSVGTRREARDHLRPRVPRARVRVLAARAVLVRERPREGAEPEDGHARDVALVGERPRCALRVYLSGAFYTLVPIRPRRRGERRSLRTLPGASLRPHLSFNPRHQRLSTPPDAFQHHPAIASYGTTLSFSRSFACF